MVDVNETQSFEYNLFRGLNLRDDELALPLGQTSAGQNFDIVRKTGLRKGKGIESFVDFNSGYRFSGATNFINKYQEPYYLTVSYPNLYLQSRDNATITKIKNDLNSDGRPFFFDLSEQQKMLVDGQNKPLLIKSDGSTQEATWPPSYTTTNSTVLNESNDATAANPTTLYSDIGFPSHGALYANRAWLAGDRYAPNRIYVSRLRNYTEFGTNSGTTPNYDVAFFVDLPSNSPITGLKVVNNEYMIIYCEREMFLLTGKFPPASGYPAPAFRFDLLNSSVGAISPFHIVDKGDNDHYFVTNRGAVYTSKNSDNFQDVRPLGISDKIFPALEGLTNETLKRGRLVNHRIRGELHFWFPSTNQKRYPDQRYVYDYNDSEQDDEWKVDKGFGKYFSFKDAFVDDLNNDLLIITPNKILKSNTGTSYDGNEIDMFYQLSTMDFGLPENNKQLVKITIYYTNLSATSTQLFLYHLWGNNEAGFEALTLEPTTRSTFGEAIYGSSTFQSFAGSPFTRVSYEPNNNIGKKLKFRIRHQDEGNIFIHSIIFRYKVLGKVE